MTDYVLRSARRSPAFAPNQHGVCLNLSGMLTATESWMRTDGDVAVFTTVVAEDLQRSSHVETTGHWRVLQPCRA